MRKGPVKPMISEEKGVWGSSCREHCEVRRPPTQRGRPDFHDAPLQEVEQPRKVLSLEWVNRKSVSLILNGLRIHLGDQDPEAADFPQFNLRQVDRSEAHTPDGRVDGGTA
jgi:hypothetical protein